MSDFNPLAKVLPQMTLHLQCGVDDTGILVMPDHAIVDAQLLLPSGKITPLPGEVVAIDAVKPVTMPAGTTQAQFLQSWVGVARQQIAQKYGVQ